MNHDYRNAERVCLPRDFEDRVKYCGTMAINAAGFVATFPYAPVTFLRWARSENSTDEGKRLSLLHYASALAGAVGGLVAIGAQAFGYYYAATHGYPELLILPAFTNATSLTHEIRRTRKKKRDKNKISS